MVVCVPLGITGILLDCLIFTLTRRGQQGVRSSAVNEDSCGYSVVQIGTPICVPAFENLSMAKAV